METIGILLLLGLAFVVFALLGPAERAKVCDHGRTGDPKCEHCPLDGTDLVVHRAPSRSTAGERGLR